MRESGRASRALVMVCSVVRDGARCGVSGVPGAPRLRVSRPPVVTASAGRTRRRTCGASVGPDGRAVRRRCRSLGAGDRVRPGANRPGAPRDRVAGGSAAVRRLTTCRSGGSRPAGSGGRSSATTTRLPERRVGARGEHVDRRSYGVLEPWRVGDRVARRRRRCRRPSGGPSRPASSCARGRRRRPCPSCSTPPSVAVGQRAADAGDVAADEGAGTVVGEDVVQQRRLAERRRRQRLRARGSDRAAQPGLQRVAVRPRSTGPAGAASPSLVTAVAVVRFWATVLSTMLTNAASSRAMPPPSWAETLLTTVLLRDRDRPGVGPGDVRAARLQEPDAAAVVVGEVGGMTLLVDGDRAGARATAGRGRPAARRRPSPPPPSS